MSKALREENERLRAEVEELRSLVRAVNEEPHPIRRQILEWLRNRPSGSPVQFVAEHDDWSLGRVAYHFRVLRDRRRIRSTRERRVRGAVQHFYAAAKPRGGA